MSDEKTDRVITQEDVANYAGVSQAIVSYVLNNGPRKVSEETRTRVLKAIQELGYRPNKNAQRLKLGVDAAQNSIGIIAGGRGHNVLLRSYYSVILERLFDSAQEMGQHVRFFTFFEGLKDPIFFNKNIHREEISALIFLLPSLIMQDPDHDLIVPQIIERIDNIICLESSIYDLPAVYIDLAAAAQVAVEHLIDLGHQRIGFLTWSDQRIVGYKRALAMHDIAFDPDLMRMIDPMRMQPSSYELTADLITLYPRITALFTANDEVAIAAMAAIHDQGLRVPDDIALVSIDNQAFASLLRPSLTTVNIPRNEIVEYALRFLLMQRDHPIKPAASILLPTQLVVRDSSGANKRPLP